MLNYDLLNQLIREYADSTLQHHEAQRSCARLSDAIRQALPPGLTNAEFVIERLFDHKYQHVLVTISNVGVRARPIETVSRFLDRAVLLAPTEGFDE